MTDPTPTPPPLDLAALTVIAEAATDGPWNLGRSEAIRGAWRIGGIAPVIRATMEDAVHMATFDPPTVLALIARVKELEAKFLDKFARYEGAKLRAEAAEAKIAAVRELREGDLCSHCLSEVQDALDGTA